MNKQIKPFLILLLFCISQLAISQTDQNIDTTKVKMNFTQYLFSCQSTYYTALKQKTLEDKYFVTQLGADYVIQAKENWLELKKLEFINENKNLTEAVPIILEFYENLYNDIEKISSFETSFGIQLVKNRLEQIVKILWKEE